MNRDSERPDSDDPTRTDGNDDALPEAREIGPYRLLERLGRGGMGEVWLAEQRRPVRRRVALKLIRSGLDSDRILARFEAERQALALMEHPAVARVFEAGATADGRPYLAMEYIRGLKITDYCDRHQLSTRQRLALFVRVCEGVQHAHRRGLIHRDLKPSNILVTEIDGAPYPKIIDFGVAKALAQPLTERTLHTEVGSLVGTLEYMSPEQADLRMQDIDTRSDVYSLGVVLYELLVGSLPFESRELRDAGLEAMLAKIRGADPPRPSARLKSLDAPISLDSAERRGCDPPTLRRQLAGDLDWITLNALEKDRERRYATPQELAEDIRRHLELRPIRARPASALYRMQKFGRRHRRAVQLGVTMAIVLLAMGGLLWFQAYRIAAERQRAFKQADKAVWALKALDREKGRPHKIDFSVDLDSVAPLGREAGNAAVWFVDFNFDDGKRLPDFWAAVGRAIAAIEVPDDRAVDQPAEKPAALLLDDPLLLEAETETERSTMRFYPDLVQPAGIETAGPNMLLIQSLVNSWLARGDGAEDLEQALAEYRRVIRLGRLLRQDDAILRVDLDGLQLIERGLEATGRRLREAGDDDGADWVELALADAMNQRIASQLARKTVSVVPYGRVKFGVWFHLDVSESKVEDIGRVAMANPNRRLRRQATLSLCFIRWLGASARREQSRRLLDRIRTSDDPLIQVDATCPRDLYANRSRNYYYP